MRWITKDNPAAARILCDSIARMAERIGEHLQIRHLRPDPAEGL